MPKLIVEHITTLPKNKILLYLDLVPGDCFIFEDQHSFKGLRVRTTTGHFNPNAFQATIACGSFTHHKVILVKGTLTWERV